MIPLQGMFPQVRPQTYAYTTTQTNGGFDMSSIMNLMMMMMVMVMMMKMMTGAMGSV